MPRWVLLLLPLLLLLRTASCARRPTAPKSVAEPTESNPLLLPPPPGAVEAAPGLFVYTRVGTWNERKGERRPGRPFSELHASDRPTFGVTLVFFPRPDFSGGEVRYTERLRLPAPPQRWDTPEDKDIPEASRPRTTITPDRRTCVTEHTIYLKPGQMIPSLQTAEGAWIFFPFPIHEWGVFGHDPAGEWSLEASVNGRRIADARFRVHVLPGPTDPDPAGPSSRSAGDVGAGERK